MTTTIERIAAILDEDSAVSRATIADMERRLSNAYREITELKASHVDVDVTQRLEEMDAALQSMTERAEDAEERCRALERIDRARTTTVTQQFVEPAQDVADLAAKLHDVIDDSRRVEAGQMKLIEKLREQKDKAHKLVAEQETIIDERDKQIEDLQVRLEIKAAAAENHRALIHERDRIIDINDDRIGGMIKELRRRDTVIVDLNKQLDEAHAVNARLVLQVAEVEAREEKNIVDMQATIRTLNERATLAMGMHANHVGAMAGTSGGPLPTADEIRAAANKAMQAVQVSMDIGRAIQAMAPKVGTPFDELLPAPTGGAGCIFPECGPACRRDCPDQTDPVVEEQGPWVVYDFDEVVASARVAGPPVGTEDDCWDWSSVDGVRGFADKARAQVLLRTMGRSRSSCCRVITLAEARAIEAKKTTGV
jgi:hypothetical protein